MNTFSSSKLQSICDERSNDAVFESVYQVKPQSDPWCCPVDIRHDLDEHEGHNRSQHIIYRQRPERQRGSVR